MLVVLLSGGRGSWKSTLDKYVHAVKRLDAEAISDLTVPDEALKVYLERYDMTKSEYKKELKENMPGYIEKLAREQAAAASLAGVKTDYEEMLSYVKQGYATLSYEILGSEEMDEELLAQKMNITAIGMDCRTIISKKAFTYTLSLSIRWTAR